ncbi:MAG: hypothetical protein Q8N46_10185 [Anaerolineales bacterium]|nr:hypothetical protein [Anaerolineales bacterium]
MQPPWTMPEETGRVGKLLLDEKNTYRLIGDEIFIKLNEEDYADLYSAEGKPGISTVNLAFVTVFQFMEKLPDRQVAESLRIRLDWKYTLHCWAGRLWPWPENPTQAKFITHSIKEVFPSVTFFDWTQGM